MIRGCDPYGLLARCTVVISGFFLIILYARGEVVSSVIATPRACERGKAIVIVVDRSKHLSIVNAMNL